MKKRNGLWLVAGSVILLCVLGITSAVVWFAQPSGWPEPHVPAAADQVIAKQRAIWEKTPFAYKARSSDHTAFGDYLNYGVSRCVPVKGSIELDSHGIAMKVMTKGGPSEYHVVLSAQCGLKAYGQVVRGHDVEAMTKETLAYADNLVTLQDEHGAFRYPFAYKYYLSDEPLPVGWVSGMAQGQALSLLARAFDLSGDERYLKAGRLAVDFLATRVEDGGVMTDMSTLGRGLDDYIFFEEYVSNPPNYTLNGFMFTLLGLYDWSKVPGQDSGQNKSLDLFTRATATLEKILPYYDLGTISAYDLGYMTYPGELPHIAARYHAVHIYLLHAMFSITGNETFHHYEKLWASYFDAE